MGVPNPTPRLKSYRRNCLVCGKEFSLFRKSKIYCGHICSAKATRGRRGRPCIDCGKTIFDLGSQCRGCYYKRINDKAKKNFKHRFMSKVKKTESCWIWTACRNYAGYGLINIKKRSSLANRVSYTIFNGKIPDGLHILHRCDNPPCVNPKHLYAGTPTDNARDKSERGRCNPPKKLTWDKVREIRAAYDGKRGFQKMMGKRFGVTPSAIRSILINRNWREHVTKGC